MREKINVLLVEDNQSDAKLIEMALIDGGFDVALCNVKTQAEYEKALEQPIDLILSDFSLPQFDGLKALNICKKMNIATPFILVSGVIEDEMAVSIMNEGAQDYILKDQLVKLVPTVKRELAEAKIKDEHKRLLYSDLEKSEFLSTMSHELRTPLNAIISFSELLQSNTCGPLNDKQKNFCENIHQSGKHLLSLINDILDLSKIDAGKSRLHEEVIDLEFLIKEALNIMSSHLKDKKITLNFICDPSISKCIFDRRRLSQIMYNLISNAIKFTPDNGEIKIEVRKVDKDDVQIIVTDTGVGFDATQAETIFEPFTQLTTDKHLREKGAGLGLMIVKRLVDLHHGSIQMKSAVGKGTQCVLIFPHRLANVQQ